MSSHYLYLAILRNSIHSLRLTNSKTIVFRDGQPVIIRAEIARLSQRINSLSALRRKIIQNLRTTCTDGWIETAELSEICAVLTALHECEPDFLNAGHIGMFIKRLLASEVAPGGPYRDAAGKVSPLLNAYIVTATSWMASAMPKAIEVANVIPDISDVPFNDYGLYALLGSDEGNDAANLFAHLIASQLAPTHDSTSSTPLAQEIYWQCRRELRRLPEPLRTCSMQALDSAINTDHHYEISLLAYSTAVEGVELQCSISCGIANILAWIAYTIYDDFLDDEGSPQLLSAAHQAHRAMRRHYLTLGLGPAFEEFMAKTLTDVDAANTRETITHRFAVSKDAITIGPPPNFYALDMLADRALFHIIGPMAVLTKKGVAIGSMAWNESLEGFRHYLIAKQLNDDIHDWQRDLQAGHITYVVAELITHFRLTPGVYSLRELITIMQQAFWQEVLPAICDEVTRHVQASLTKLRPPHGGELYRLIYRLEQEMVSAKKKIADSRALTNLFSPSINDTSGQPQA